MLETTSGHTLLPAAMGQTTALIPAGSFLSAPVVVPSATVVSTEWMTGRNGRGTAVTRVRHFSPLFTQTRPRMAVAGMVT